MTCDIERRIMLREVGTVDLLNAEDECCGHTRLERGHSVFIDERDNVGLVPSHMSTNVRLRMTRRFLDSASIAI